MRLGDGRIRRQMQRLWRTPKARETIPPAVYRELIDAATTVSTQLQLLRRGSGNPDEAVDSLETDLERLIRVMQRYRPNH